MPPAAPTPDAELDLAAERVLPMGVTPGGVFLGLAPLYHSAPSQHTFTALQLAQTVVLGSGFDPAHVLGVIQRYQVTDTFLVPTMMHRLVTAPAEIRSAHDLSSLRVVVHAGSICPVPVKRGLPGAGEAGDDRLAGPDRVRVQRRERIGEGHPDHRAAMAGASRLGRPRRARLRRPGAGRARQRAAVRRAGTAAPAGPAPVQLPQRPGQDAAQSP